jgi:hypothetical protein
MSRVGADRSDAVEQEDFPRIELVRDVLVVPSPGHRANEDDWEANPPVEEAVDLGSGVFIERIDNELAEQVLDASTPRGLNFEATRQFGQMYALWRDVPGDEYEANHYGWDTSQSISEVVAVSRFVLDNAHSFEFVGRVIDRSEGSRKIVPLLGFDGRIAYRARKDRFWFTAEEAKELRTLLDVYRALKDGLPDRVKRAVWAADRSCYCRYMQETLTHIVTGLEALLNTGDDEPITAQFVKRSQALAAEFGIETSRSYWSWVYKARSKVVHGAESQLVAPTGWDESEGDLPPDVARIAQAQDVLRIAIRNALADEELRSVFQKDESIRARWPLEEEASPKTTD